MNDKLPPSLNRFGPELEQAIRRELGSRRDPRLLRLLRARPRLLAGTTIGAAATGALLAIVLSAAGSSPAFAVARNRDGSYTVTLRSLSAIPAANRKLSQLGLRTVLVQAAAKCPALKHPVRVPAPARAAARVDCTAAPTAAPPDSRPAPRPGSASHPDHGVRTFASPKQQLRLRQRRLRSGHRAGEEPLQRVVTMMSRHPTQRDAIADRVAERQPPMSRIVVVNNISLDGVMQAPARADEDRRGGFEHGGWAVPNGDEVMARKMGASMTQGGSLLLGRRTYEDFYAVWHNAPHPNPYTERLNNTRKYVVSKTLAEPLPWVNSTLLRGDGTELVARLKQDLPPGEALCVLGSGALLHSLIPRGLIDEYLLLIHPVVLGGGLRLFPTASTPC